MEATNADLLADKLTHLGYIVTSIKEQKGAMVLDDLFIPLTRIRTDDMIMLSTQLAAMIGSGISLPNSLRILSDQIENKRLKKIIEEVNNDIKGGATFSDALRKHPEAFSTFFVNMIGAGETAGNLEEVLRRLAVFAEKEAELKQKVLTAMFYPLILIVVGICVVFFVITGVLPAFVKIFTEANVPLPLPTKVLFIANNLIRAYWLYMVFGILGSVLAVNYYKGTPGGRLAVDKWKLSIPVTGDIVRKVTIARMCRTLAALISSGVPMLRALQTLESTIDNSVMSNVIRNVYENVSKGESISEPLKASGEFTPMTVHMVAIGEETGALDALLNKVADYYELASDFSIRRLTTLLEPIFLVVIAGMVGFIFAAIILPIFRMVGTLRR